MVKKIEQCSGVPDTSDWISKRATSKRDPVHGGTASSGLDAAAKGGSKIAHVAMASSSKGNFSKAAQPEPEHRDGRALWQFLRPRLRLLVKFEQMWGSLHDLYPQQSESTTISVH